MNNKIVFVTLLVTGLSSLVTGMVACNKNSSPAPLPPVAGFLIDNSIPDSVVTMGTYDQVQLTNSSANASSPLWDFGNDSVYTRQDVVLTYPKSGLYTLTLTVKNAGGIKSIISRKIRVLDRVIRQVVINNLNDLNVPVNHSLNNSRVWAVIRLGGNNTAYPMPAATNMSFSAPIVFQSPVITNFDSTRAPYTITVPGKMILDFPALAVLSENNLGYKGVGYGIELYAQDASGIYLLSSSYEYFYKTQSGAITWPVADIKKDLFIARYGDVDVVCDYE